MSINKLVNNQICLLAVKTKTLHNILTLNFDKIYNDKDHRITNLKILKLNCYILSTNTKNMEVQGLKKVYYIPTQIYKILNVNSSPFSIILLNKFIFLN